MGVVERRERERRERRLRIMDAANRLFSAKGFSGATMEEIAQEAELSPATLYNYFKNKFDLFASLNVRMLRRQLECLESVKNRTDLGPREKIVALGEAYWDLYSFDPLILINVVHLQASELLKGVSPEMIQEINGLAAKALRTTAAIFDEGIGAGVIEARNPIALADICWSLFSGLVLWEEGKRLFDPGKQFLQSTLRLGFELLARGLRRDAGG